MLIKEKKEMQEVLLSEKTDNSLVISAVMHLSGQMGFSTIHQSIISTAASELATNILKYAGEGRIIISSCSCEERKGILIEAVDTGPGIQNLDRALKDNYSTGGTLGLGLSGIKRMMDRVHIHTEQDKGTWIKAVKWITP